MTDHPIIFTGPTVRAILDGTKTQTRRAISRRIQPVAGSLELGNDVYGGMLWYDDNPCREAISPYGVVGDRLWVRHAHWRGGGPTNDQVWDEFTRTTRWENGRQILDHDLQLDEHGKHILLKKKPSIHMPRWASRITLEVTDICVQQVQDISLGDCIAEGMNLDMPMNDYGTGARERDSLAQLWDSINAKRGEYDTDEFWVPDTDDDLPRGEYEFSWDGTPWQRFEYWPHTYDRLTDTWLGPCIGNDPEAWMLDVVDPSVTRIRVWNSRVLGVRRVKRKAKTIQRLLHGFGWDANPHVWALTFKRITAARQPGVAG